MSPEANDRIRILLKAASDCVKRLDAIYSNGKAIKTVFSYEAYGYRLRLKETLQKLISLDPTHQARRAEELMWRKVFYEPLHLYKTYVKQNDRPDRVAEFEIAIKTHLLSGVGYYRSLLLQLQSDSFKNTNGNHSMWLTTAFHIPLYNASTSTVRYLLEFGESIGKHLAYTYYNAAINFDPTSGLPHNQLGILDVGRCYGLNAIFHYLHCLCASVPFEGARRNLFTVLSKNELRYRKLFGDKPLFGLYNRRPNRYRPKDFRKTITKFIYLIQHYLQSVSPCDEKSSDPSVPHVFQDTLVELHLMLSMSSDLTLEAELIDQGPNESDRTDGMMAAVDAVELRRDASLFSERLTGPIFVRILLIALLTAQLHASAKVRQKTDAPITTMAAESESSPSETVDSIEDEQLAKVEVSPVETSTPTTERIADPFGPLSFLLQLSELYMTHVSHQITDHLDPSVVDELSERHGDHKPTSQSPVRVDSPTSQCSDHSLTGDETTPHENGRSDVNQSSTTKDKNRLVIKGKSSRQLPAIDNDSEGEDAENTPEEEPEESDDMEFLEDSENSASDGDLWSSEDSSEMHSQDDMDSAGSSSAEDDLADQRLRRAHLSGGNSHVRRNNRAGLSGRGYLRGSMADRANPNTASTVDPEHSKAIALDTICEEESSVTPGKAGDGSRVSRSSDAHRSTRSRTTSETDSSQHSSCAMTDSRDKPTSRRSRYSRRVDIRTSSSPDQHHDKQHSDDNSPWLNPSTDTNNSNYRQAKIHPVQDVRFEAQLIGRLYLLASIKLVMDWIQSNHFNVMNKLSQSMAVHSEESAQAQLVIQYTMQRWCTQLALLMNQLSPMCTRVVRELTNNETLGTNQDDKPSDPMSDVPDSPPHYTSQMPGHASSHLSPHLSTIGRYAVQSHLSADHIVECKMNSIDTDPHTPDEVKPSETMELDPCFLPLPEDWLLQGLPALQEVHKRFNFNQGVLQPSFSQIDEAILRSIRMSQVARHMANHAAQFGVQFTFQASSDTRPFRAFTPPNKYKASSHGPSGQTAAYHHPHNSRHRPHRSFYARSGLPDRHFGPGGRLVAPTTRGSRGWIARGRRPDPSWHGASSRGQFTVAHGSMAHNDHHVAGEKQDRRSARDRDDGTAVAKQSSNSSLPPTTIKTNSDTLVNDHYERPSPSSDGVVTNEEPQVNEADAESRKAQMMRDMARLRLLNEVDQLTRQCRNPSPQLLGDERNKETEISPYLVLDAYCWANHLAMVKNFVGSKAFVVIVPIAVVAHLDYLKKTTATARVAIRYLEQESHAGNNFISLQRPEEQPTEPMAQNVRIIPSTSRKSSCPDVTNETAPDVDCPNESPGRNAIPRVVKRWLSILDCASYFTQSLSSSHEPQPENDVNPTDKPQSSKAPIGSLNSHDNAPVTMVNNPLSCQDLLKIGRPSSNPSTNCELQASVTILIGTRDTNPEDTIVPGEYISFVRNSGVRLELIGDFMTRWRKTRT